MAVTDDTEPEDAAMRSSSVSTLMESGTVTLDGRSPERCQIAYSFLVKTTGSQPMPYFDGTYAILRSYCSAFSFGVRSL